MYNIEDIKVNCIAMDFPEAYELVIKEKGREQAVMALIGGKLTVEYPDLDGEVIYESYPAGKNHFLASERGYWVNECKKAFLDFINAKKEG